MEQLYLTAYRHPGTEPFGSIMMLPEEEAFREAARLAAAHPDTTAFYRFADFANYYPLRKASEEALREAFLAAGGQPELAHPCSFVLMENDYLHRWFGQGDSIRIPLDALPPEQVSFTLGDSVSSFSRDGRHQLLTVEGLRRMMEDHGGSLQDFMTHVENTWRYIEAQVWSLNALQAFRPREEQP